MSNWLPYGKNLIVKPREKNKIIGDTATKYLYGDVMAVGEDVTRIKVGDVLAYTQWGFEKVIEDDGTETYFVQDNDDFILGIKHE